MDEESIVLQTPKSPPHHRHWLWPPIETIVGRSLHSLPTGLIKTPWIGVRAFVLYLSLGLARRFGAIAEVFTKAMPYVRPEVHKLQRTALYSNQTGERGSRNQVLRVQTVLLPRGYEYGTSEVRVEADESAWLTLASSFQQSDRRWMLNSSRVKCSEPSTNCWDALWPPSSRRMLMRSHQ